MAHRRGFEGPAIDDVFRSYANNESGGRGLPLVCLLTDVDVDVDVGDAPTRILEGSHHAMVGLVRPFGEAGVLGLKAPLPDAHGRTALATEAGDASRCHPFLVHSTSWPHRGAAPRFLAQPPISLEGSLRIQAQVGR